MIVQNFATFMHEFTGWADTQPEILAAIVAGSQARSDRPADEWSDLDIIAYTTNSDQFIQDAGWLEQFGEVWARAVDHTPRGDPEWYIFYAGGRKVDILFVDVQSLQANSLAGWVQHPDFSEVLSRGMRVLVDKTMSRGKLPELPARPSGLPPTQENLDGLTNRFYLSAVKAGRLLQRADLWRARQAIDDEMKTHLLTLLEWHAMAQHGPDHDVWYDGRFLRDWADPQALQRLPECFGGFEKQRL
jgi:aminoglycoside 6-adenylyltransferase